MGALRDSMHGKSRTVTVAEGPALWRGEVVEVLSTGLVWVLIPRMGGNDPIGPINAVPTGLQPGDRVVVGAVGGDVNDLLVLSLVAVPAVPAPSWDEVAGKPSVFPPSAHTHSWDSVTAKPTTFSPSAHTHPWVDVTGKPAAFVPAAHAHAMGDVTGLDAVLASKSATGHTHPVATAALDGLMPAADKANLDAATSSAVVNGSIVRRTSGGHIQGQTFYSEAAQSASSTALTRRDYVDGLVAGRAPLVHRHNYSDIDGTVPTSALPPLAVTDTFTASSQAAMLALVAQRGDMCIRTDTSLTFVLAADDATQLVNWKQILAAGQVLSVNGKTGVVSLTKADVGLGSVDNTSDANKPVSTATQTALNGKAATAHTHAAADVTSGVFAADRLPAATQTVQGAMSRLDKVKLDNATSSALASAGSLVSRDLSGRYQVATPTIAVEVANKGYVDGLAKRGDWTKLTLAAGWADYTGGGYYREGAWWSVIGDELHVSLMVKSGAVGSNICTIPTILIPTYNGMHNCVAAGAQAIVQVNPAGDTAKAGQIHYLAGPAAPGYLSAYLRIPLT